MDTFKDDIIIVKRLIEDFISQKHFTKGLAQISEIGITGWEKWWQIELGIFVAEYPGIEEWDMEHPFDVDGRKADFTTLYVDLGFTMKGWKGEYVFLELKQNNDYKKCIDLMFKDAEKYEFLKNKSVEGIRKRSVFVVGMFLLDDWDHIQEYFDSCMKHYDFDLSEDEFMFLESKSHRWGMLIF